MKRALSFTAVFVLVACGGPAFNDACPPDTHVEGKDCVKVVTAGASGAAGSAGKAAGGMVAGGTGGAGGWAGGAGGANPKGGASGVAGAAAAGAGGGGAAGKSGGGGNAGKSGSAGGGSGGSAGKSGAAGFGGGSAGKAGAAGSDGTGGNSAVGGTAGSSVGGTSAGAAGSSSCPVNDLKCDGAQPVACADGKSYTATGAACATAALCSAGACSAPACGAGETVCMGKDTYACNADQTQLVKGVTCGTSQICDQGACVNPLSVVAGERNACALFENGALYCWGTNQHGQVGSGNVGTIEPLPVRVLADASGNPLAGVVEVVAGSESLCARLASGDVLCWGGDAKGSLGDDPAVTPSTGIPVKVALDVPAKQLSAWGFDVCALGNDGYAYCWGYDGVAQLPSGFVPAKQQGGPFKRIAVGQLSRCGVTDDGGVVDGVECWGLDDYGALGDGHSSPSFDSATPQVVLSELGVAVSGASELAVGNGSACVVSGSAGGNGNVLCWGGSSDFGQLGLAPNTSNYSVATKNYKTALSVGLGNRFACARRQGLSTTQNVICWGDNVRGELGRGTASAGGPADAPVVGVVGATSLAVGVEFACAVSGSPVAVVQCWGANETGQLGTGTTMDSPSALVVEMP